MSEVNFKVDNSNNRVLSKFVSYLECESFWKDLPLSLGNYAEPYDWAIDTGYGLIDILKDYAGYSIDYIPKINVLHGTFMGMKDSWWLKSEASLKSVPGMFVFYNTIRDKLNLLFNSSKSFYSIKHPYHLILENYKSEISIEKSGSVLFLPHSLGYGLLFNIDFLLNYLNTLTQDYYPIKICIHPADISRELLEKFKSEKFKVVCCGSRFDPDFLHRFFWICNGSKYCLSVDLSTHTILSSLSGLDIVPLYNKLPMINWVHGNQIVYYDIPDSEYNYIIESFFENSIDQNLFKYHCNIVTGGVINVSKKQLRTMFEECEFAFNNERFFGIKIKYLRSLEKIIKIKEAYTRALKNRLSGNNKIIQPVSTDLFYQLYRYYKTFN